MDALLSFPIEQALPLALALLVAGAVTGFLSGLFGVGGGAVIVPVLYEVFGLVGVNESVRAPLAISTSLAVIIPTSLRSFAGHKAKDAVEMPVLKLWALPVFFGVVVGVMIARHADPSLFLGVFAVVTGFNALKLLLAGDRWRLGSTFPDDWIMRSIGATIGLLSSLMGIGGGVMSTMVQTVYGRPVLTAIATSSGVGVIISIPATLGYVYAGWPQMGVVPPFSLGYVSLIGVALLVPLPVVTAPIGVQVAHALPRRILEMSFGLFLLAVSTRFLFAFLGS